MAQNETNFYNLDPRIAEIYDQIENKTPDIDLIRHFNYRQEEFKDLGTLHRHRTNFA